MGARDKMKLAVACRKRSLLAIIRMNRKLSVRLVLIKRAFEALARQLLDKLINAPQGMLCRLNQLVEPAKVLHARGEKMAAWLWEQPHVAC